MVNNDRVIMDIIDTAAEIELKYFSITGQFH